ncbi:hypothetical protein KFZ08_25760, partial [Salmonella enterica subsp. enterica serovar Typhimurium]|nr:hypothetical protein [Salmonella enterica subsp. enterica serovar Typhimurium]
MKLTDKPLSFGYSVVDSHSSCRPVKAFFNGTGSNEMYTLSLHDALLSYSVVDSHSSCRPVKAKT